MYLCLGLVSAWVGTASGSMTGGRWAINVKDERGGDQAAERCPFQQSHRTACLSHQDNLPWSLPTSPLEMAEAMAGGTQEGALHQVGPWLCGTWF